MKHAIATTTLAAALGVFGVAAAQAGVGDGIASANVAAIRIAPVENAQFIFGGQNYCWYDSGWQGPGWYWCGYALAQRLWLGRRRGFHGWSRSGHGRHGQICDKGPGRPMIGPHTTHSSMCGRWAGPKGGHKGGQGRPQAALKTAERHGQIIRRPRVTPTRDARRIMPLRATKNLATTSRAACGSPATRAVASSFGLRIGHFEAFQRIEDDLRDDQPSVHLVVGGNDMPGRVCGAGRARDTPHRLSCIASRISAPRCRRG